MVAVPPHRHANRPSCPLPGIKGGMCSAGVSFLLGFFWSDSTFRATCAFFPFLGFFLRSQSLMSWSERSSDFDRMQRKKKKNITWVRFTHKLVGFQLLVEAIWSEKKKKRIYIFWASLQRTFIVLYKCIELNRKLESSMRLQMTRALMAG